jgi:hypothetical protein
MSVGTDRVRVDFNPSNSSPVYVVKSRTADLIDLLEAEIAQGERSEKARLVAIAMTKYEEAAMWAVKALTA